MSYANYTNISLAVAFCLPFAGNSASGEFESDDENGGGVYRVYSYGTLIAWKNDREGSFWISPTRYSKTTSRIQNIVRREWKD